MQPPQGYPQNQPQHFQQGPGPQGPPQHGMAPMPYYPQQQKQGMPAWAWVLIICGVGFAVLIVGILALAAIPLITSNTRDARRAEGEHLMGSARGVARVEYSKTAQPPLRFSQITSGSFSMHDLQGKYFHVDDAIGSKPGDRGEITCTPQQSPKDGRGRMEFSWQDGNSQIFWN
jgi:hypothetical protein